MRHSYEHIRTVGDMLGLGESEFKEFLADVFRDAGYLVFIPPEPLDQSVRNSFTADFIMLKDGRRIIVEVAHCGDAAGLDVVKNALFARIRLHADESWVVSAYGFTSLAVSRADIPGMRLVMGEDILRLIEEAADLPRSSRQLEVVSVHDRRVTLTASGKNLFTLSGKAYEELVHYQGEVWDVAIPSDLGVRRIGSHLFGCPEDPSDAPEDYVPPVCDWKNVRSVVIPEGVVSIGYKAFKGCASLQSVILPSTLEYIGLGAFEGCSSLYDIEFPDSLKKIGPWAFRGCKSLRDIRIPQSLEEIDSYAFEGCDSLGEPVLVREQGEQKIGSYAFSESGITSLTISGNILLGEGCFRSCRQLESVAILDVASDEGQSFSHEAAATARIGLETLPESTFEQCASLENVELPSTLLSIGDRAFAGCEGLFAIELPDSVREIGTAAFEGCSILWSIDVPESVETIQAETFTACKMLSRVYLFDGLRKIEGRAFRQCRMLEKIALPSSIETLAPLAFEGCERLSEVVISGEGCQGTFYRSAFLGCPVLERTAPIGNLPSAATLANDMAYPEMFESPSYELHALMFETYDRDDAFRRKRDFFIVDRGVEGLNSFSEESADGRGAQFWVELNDGCDRGYYAVKDTTDTRESGSIIEGYLEPKRDELDEGDPSRRKFYSLKGPFSIYLCDCHLVASSEIDSDQAARVVDEYRSTITPLVEEYRRVKGDKSGQGKKFEADKLAVLDGLHEKIASVNEQFRTDARSVGLDCEYYVGTYAGSLGSGSAPSVEAARYKAIKDHEIARKRSESGDRLFGCLVSGCFNGCGLLVVLFLTLVVMAELLMFMFI